MCHMFAYIAHVQEFLGIRNVQDCHTEPAILVEIMLTYFSKQTTVECIAHGFSQAQLEAFLGLCRLWWIQNKD